MKLYTAVVKEIKEQTKSFSAHQITKNLRDKVNNSKLVIDDVQDIELSTGEVVAEVDHFEVNSIIKDIYNDKIVELKRTLGTGFYLYELDNTNSVTIQQKITGFSVPNNILSLGNNIKKAAVLPTWSKDARHKLYVKVATYVSNKRKNKERMTLKQIQSSIKFSKLSIQDIAAVCNKLGYKVIQKTPAYKSEVK